jgi:predicted small secreted protein
MTQRGLARRVRSSAAGLTSRTRIDDNPSLQEPPIMFTPRNSIFIFVAACSLAMAACQPAEGPAERAGKNVDKAAKKVGDQVDKAADKVKDAVNDAKK